MMGRVFLGFILGMTCACCSLAETGCSPRYEQRVPPNNHTQRFTPFSQLHGKENTVLLWPKA